MKDIESFKTMLKLQTKMCFLLGLLSLDSYSIKSAVFRESVRQNARHGFEKKGFTGNLGYLEALKCHFEASNWTLGPSNHISYFAHCILCYAFTEHYWNDDRHLTVTKKAQMMHCIDSWTHTISILHSRVAVYVCGSFTDFGIEDDKKNVPDLGYYSYSSLNNFSINLGICFDLILTVVSFKSENSSS